MFVVLLYFSFFFRYLFFFFFFFSSRRRHTRSTRDWSSDVCSSDLLSKSVVLRYFKQSRRIGRYKACVNRETGFSDSGLSLPRTNIVIRIGTSVIDRKSVV